jgi:flagellin
MLSVNTNYGAFVALQNLNATNKALDETQSRINTGLKVAGPKDNGAIYAVAQGLRAEVTSLGAVQNSLDRSVSVVDTAIAAGQSISDLLTEMKEKALAAKDATIDTNARAAYNADFVALRDQITKVIENASFDGTNLIDGSATGGIEALANAAGSSFITASTQDLSLSGSIVSLSATATISTATKASSAISTIEESIDALGLALASLGTDSKKLSMHKTFIGKLTDELNKGIGNLVDADLAKESARLQALQTKQQLGIQSLSIANQAPSTLLSLFR